MDDNIKGAEKSFSLFSHPSQMIYSIVITHNMGAKEFAHELKWLLRVYYFDYKMIEDDVGNYHFEINTPIPIKEPEEGEI